MLAPMALTNAESVPDGPSLNPVLWRFPAPVPLSFSSCHLLSLYTVLSNKITIKRLKKL